MRKLLTIILSTIIIGATLMVTGCSDKPLDQQVKETVDQKVEEANKNKTPEQLKKEADEKEIRTFIMDYLDVYVNSDYKTYNPATEYKFLHPYLIEREKKYAEEYISKSKEYKLKTELVDADVVLIVPDIKIDNQQAYFGDNKKDICKVIGRYTYKIADIGEGSTVVKSKVGDTITYDFEYVLVKENEVWKLFSYKLTPVAK